MYNFMDQVVDDDLLEKSSCDQQMICSEGEDGEPWKLIECEPLAEMLKSGLDKVLLIDSRSFLEYNTSRIQQSVNVCCSKLVKRRLQQDKVQIKDLLTQTCHIDVEEYSDVIVYDQCTALPSILTEDNFLIILLRKLMTCPAFQNVTLLKGGYLAFQAMHPVLCENKNSNSYKCTPLTSLSQPCLPVSNVGPTRILPFLYLGSHRDAMSQETVQVNDISYVLNVSTTCPKPPFIQEGHFFRIPVNDNYSAKMMPFFEEAFQFLDKVREANGCVLVHCLAGISRSPTLAIAYVMKHLNMSSDDAYRYVKDKRPTISPNFNFLGQLLEFERKVGDGEEENNKRVKRDVFCRGNESRHPPASVMDLRSPSSPVAKMSKPFTFDALWPPENLPEATVAGCVKVDANDNMTLTSGLESLSNVRVKEKMSHTKDLNLCSERTSSNSMHISRLGNSVTRESNTNVILSRESASEAYSPSYTCTSPRSFSHCSFSQGLGLTPVSESPSLMTPCSEQPPFPFGGMGSETQGPIPDIPDKENTKNEVRALSTSPRSRSFTLPLSPVTLPLQSMACSLNSPCEGSSSISYTKQDCMITGGKRAFSVASPLSVSPGRKFSKPFTLPLSPVLSPASDKSMSPMDAETSTKKMSKPSELTFSSELRRQQSETFVPSKQDHVISSCSESYSESASSSMSSSMFSSMSVSSSSGSFVMTQNQSMSSSSSSSSSSSKKISKSFHLSLSPVTLPGSDSKASDLCKSNTSESGYQTVNKSTNLPQDSKIENVSSLPSINDQVNSGNNVFTNRSLDNMQKGIVRKRNLSLSLSLSLSNPPQLKSPDDAMETDSSDLSSSDLLPSDGSCESKASRPATLPSALCSPDYEQSIHREKKKHKSWNSDSNCLKNNKNLSASSSLLSSPVSRVQAVASSNIQSPSAALARLHFGQVVQEEQIPSETVTMENKSSAHNFPSTSLDKLNFTPCFAKSASSSPSSLSPSMSMPSSSTAPQFMTSTSSVSSNAIDMSSPSTISSNELVSPSSICSIGSSPPSSAVSSPSSAPSKVILRSKGNRAKKCLVRPASIAFSTYPTCDLGSDCQESPSSGSNTSQDDSSETYMLQNSKRSKPNTEMDSSGHYRYGRYSEREVYKQITAAMESAMLRTQVYEANRKARSLDDILSSEGQESPDVECVCTPFGKLPRRCVERVSSTGLFENMPCRCQGQQELYQSNSSISSSGSHSSLHGSLEIIQGQSAMEESFSAIPVQPPSPNAWIWCPQPP